MIKTALVIAAAAIVAVPALAVPAQNIPGNLVQNGSFENTGTMTGNFQFDSSYAAGAGKLANWSSVATAAHPNPYNLLFHSNNANSVAGNAAGNYSYTNAEYLWASTASPDGGNFVALDGDPSINVAMTQTINGLVIGQKYDLSFYWAAGQIASRTGATTEQIQYSLGNDVFKTNVISLPSQGFSGWNQVSKTFTATGTSQLLSFLSIGTPTGLPPVALLDGVSLTAAVPESATWAMMIVGFGAVGSSLRRSRRQALARA